ncbi:cell division protein ZapE [Photorhabdus hainanensis]|uniref:cell division protein ZapE n=1 Tax=Photorhabdus hainanensis TaxID=1004166 RepID=UPI001BD63F10|nr:cell division protein ZapE [Photorhabdus hainanensis]MBS9433477.1 cell division protein ZapE [Photorhabdus hainanensis]
MEKRAKGIELQQAIQKKAQFYKYTLDKYQISVVENMVCLINTMLRRSWFKRPCVKGIYIWGPVGRGKSFILDTFFEAAPIKNKRRVHFHHFFRELHQLMNLQAGKKDLMEATLHTQLQNCQLLCFDEFHLHDIGDAMLISRLLNFIFQRGIVLITTSNYPPNDLLANPLYHERFLPAIQLIEKNMKIVSMEGEIDYRCLAGNDVDPFCQGAYVWPGNEEQRIKLSLPEHLMSTIDLKVGYRMLSVLSAANGTIHLTFQDLCSSPTAVMDYLALSERYQCWIIEDVPELGQVSSAAQQRFINVVDVLYDQRCQLFLIGCRPLDDKMFDGVELADISRTRSRLSQLKQYGLGCSIA